MQNINDKPLNGGDSSPVVDGSGRWTFRTLFEPYAFLVTFLFFGVAVAIFEFFAWGLGYVANHSQLFGEILSQIQKSDDPSYWPKALSKDQHTYMEALYWLSQWFLLIMTSYAVSILTLFIGRTIEDRTAALPPDYDANALTVQKNEIVQTGQPTESDSPKPLSVPTPPAVMNMDEHKSMWRHIKDMWHRLWDTGKQESGSRTSIAILSLAMGVLVSVAVFAVHEAISLVRFTGNVYLFPSHYSVVDKWDGTNVVRYLYDTAYGCTSPSCVHNEIFWYVFWVIAAFVVMTIISCFVGVKIYKDSNNLRIHTAEALADKLKIKADSLATQTTKVKAALTECESRLVKCIANLKELGERLTAKEKDKEVSDNKLTVLSGVLKNTEDVLEKLDGLAKIPAVQRKSALIQTVTEYIEYLKKLPMDVQVNRTEIMAALDDAQNVDRPEQPKTAEVGEVAENKKDTVTETVEALMAQFRKFCGDVADWAKNTQEDVKADINAHRMAIEKTKKDIKQGKEDEAYLLDHIKTHNAHLAVIKENTEAISYYDPKRVGEKSKLNQVLAFRNGRVTLLSPLMLLQGNYFSVSDTKLTILNRIFNFALPVVVLVLLALNNFIIAPDVGINLLLPDFVNVGHAVKHGNLFLISAMQSGSAVAILVGAFLVPFMIVGFKLPGKHWKSLLSAATARMIPQRYTSEKDYHKDELWLRVRCVVNAIFGIIIVALLTCGLQVTAFAYSPFLSKPPEETPLPLTDIAMQNAEFDCTVKAGPKNKAGHPWVFGESGSVEADMQSCRLAGPNAANINYLMVAGVASQEEFEQGRADKLAYERARKVLETVGWSAPREAQAHMYVLLLGKHTDEPSEVNKLLERAHADQRPFWVLQGRSAALASNEGEIARLLAIYLQRDRADLVTKDGKPRFALCEIYKAPVADFDGKGTPRAKCTIGAH